MSLTDTLSREPAHPTALTVTPSPEPTPLRATRTPPALGAGLDLALNSIDMITANVGWATGRVPRSDDRVLHTEDGGHTWADVSPPEPFRDDPHNPGPYWAIGHFFDARTAIVVYSSSGIVWRTEDGGLSWKVPTASIGIPQYFSFPTRSTGWALALDGYLTMGAEVAELFRSRDGGANWELVVDAINDARYLQECAKTGLAFANDEVGWVTLACQYGIWYSDETGEPWIETTADGGITWTQVPIPPPAGDPRLFAPSDDFHQDCRLSSPRLFTPLNGVLALACTVQDLAGGHQRQANFLYRTLDGGASWTTYEMPGSWLEVINQLHMWSIRPDVPFTSASIPHLYRIYRSDDAGASWALVNTTNWEGQFSFVDERLVFAIALSPTGETALVKSSDGGASWQIIRPVTAASKSTPQPTPAEIPPVVEPGTWTPVPSE